MSPHHHRIFFVTGVSSGLGRAFAHAALDDGHSVVGTVRKSADADAFSAMAPGRAIARELDVTDDDAVFAVVDDVESTVGPIDVAIANAGYGHEGVFEESPMSELRAQFAANVFGAVATVKAVLPHMRRRRAGHIFGVTSMGGMMTVPGLAYYHGSKYALEGILETVGKEVKALGIHVTAVEPGSFRTDWAGRSMVRTERSISDYDELMNPVRANRIAASGNQLGDPAKAGQALLAVIDSPNPPAHLILGSDALRLVTNGRAAVDEEIAAWAELSRSTDFPDGAQIAN
ncbi:oxidoreductase [Mycolicibacterium aichiense]|uniref:Short-chain dehydrogenase/reductase n=1 Tax=Mycolicibacterium aichiense TaxID=1799 RepID=A0AAD1HSV7_9MYCO|nr:oxidoreductase [Mycolicibacterium aichiense]MCV7017213.1 oxidoreductase [Mycolicibacterium aichiense]BBX10359.1 short-chain dehydrogenase/reductase [Mycolicibacterium aichiense]STZ25983.1 short chain dehydrogenase [Mycolicibacterium aichiense]